jgi:hypothetical protein
MAHLDARMLELALAVLPAAPAASGGKKILCGPNGRF